jgi:hypothetical protein
LVVTKKPGFQKPSTRTATTTMTASRPTMPPMTASDFLEPSSVPDVPYGEYGCPGWPY